MAIRTPLILISGSFSQLPSGDTVPGSDPVAIASGNAALTLASTALSSGNSALVVSTSALASGNAALVNSSTALASGNAALATASSALAAASTYQTLSNTTTSLAFGASADFTINAGSVFVLLQVTSSHPSWVRVYNTNAARDADTRTSPGSPYPSTGSGFYAEVLTNQTPQTVEMSPSPVCRGVSGVAYVRARNDSGSTVNLVSTFRVLTLASGS